MKKGSLTKHSSSKKKNTIDLDLFSSGKRDKESLLMSADTGGTPSISVGSALKDKKLNIKKVIFVSLGFFLIFNSYYMTLNITSYVLIKLNMDDFKNVLINLYFASSVLGTFLGQIILRKFMVRKSMIISGITHLLVITACILPAWKLEYPVDEDSSL